MPARIATILLCVQPTTQRSPPVRFCPGGRRAPACAEKTNPEARLPQCEPDKADTKGYEGRAGIDQYSVVRPCK